MLLLLLTCSALSQLSTAADLINAIYGRFRDVDLQKGSPERQELSNLFESETESELDVVLLSVTSVEHTGSNENAKIICELLLNKGANINVRDQWGRTPLMRRAAAALPRNPDFMEFLLRKGANPFLKSAGGSALDFALLHCNYKRANVLRRYMSGYVRAYVEEEGWRLINALNPTFFMQKNINFWPVRTEINEFLGFYLQPRKYAQCEIRPTPFIAFRSASQKMIEESETQVKETKEFGNNPKN